MLQNKDATETAHDNLGELYFDQLWDSRFKDCRLFGLIALILETMQSNITIFNPSISTPPEFVNRSKTIRKVVKISRIPGNGEINLA